MSNEIKRPQNEIKRPQDDPRPIGQPTRDNERERTGRAGDPDFERQRTNRPADPDSDRLDQNTGQPAKPRSGETDPIDTDNE